LEAPVHISRLREYVHDAIRSDPAKVAQADTFDFEVEEIIDHHGDSKKKSTLDFLVRWQGYDSSHDLWLPWKELRNNIHLHKYLRKVGLTKLIPKDADQDEDIAIERAKIRKSISRAK
jgi:hypothetical protein